MNPKTPDAKTDFGSEALHALKEFKEEETSRQQEKISKAQKKDKIKKRRIIGQWVVLILCIGIILYQAPLLISAVKSDVKPLRQGPYNTDTLTDQCIQNLWRISKLVQEGKLPNDTIVCPASKRPFMVVKTKTDIIVRSPNPELYGFKSIQVSKKKPVPELIK
ncbi:hypothetical protein ACFL9U_06000 [Thermodesulfobacteriota bacterium]